MLNGRKLRWFAVEREPRQGAPCRHSYLTLDENGRGVGESSARS